MNSKAGPSPHWQDSTPHWQDAKQNGWEVGCLRATYSGTPFSLSNPDPGNVNPLDILVPLSRLERWGGHCQVDFTVGQHSWLVSQQVPRRFALAGLLHDAAEAYIGDLSRPFRQLLGDRYREIEEPIEWAIAKRFGLESLYPPEIRVADDRMLATELRDVMPPQGFTFDREPYVERLIPWKRKRVLLQLVERFEELTGENIDRRLLPRSRKQWLETYMPFAKAS
jgi:hypothetical protein